MNKNIDEAIKELEDNRLRIEMDIEDCKYRIKELDKLQLYVDIMAPLLGASTKNKITNKKQKLEHKLKMFEIANTYCDLALNLRNRES